MEEKTLRPILFGLKAVLIIVGVILVYMTVSGWNSNWEVVKAEAIIPGDSPYDGFMGGLNGLVTFVYILLWITIIGVVIFGLLGMAKNFKKTLPFLIGIAGMLAIFGISYYGLASGAVDQSWEVKEMPSAEMSKLAGASIKTVFILLGIAILGIVYMQVSRIFK